MATVSTIDFDAVFNDIASRLQKETEQRLVPPLVRFWDGDWNLRGVCKREISANFMFANNETGTGSIEMPLEYYLSRWLIDVDDRPTSNVHITVDKDGARWDGRMDELQIIKDEDGRKYVRVLFKSSYEELHHILAWSNPFAWPPTLN